MNNYIKTPLNYTGNKFRLLEQIQPHFPKKVKVMVDLFCGGATVGTNTDCEKIYFIDNNPMVIGLLQFFHKSKFDKLLKSIEDIINEFGLSNSYRNGYKFYREKIEDENKNNGLKEYNKIPYYNLRKHYNGLKNKKTIRAYTMLYVLILYSFNNDIRFNSKEEFNLPIGKTDFNKSNVLKLQKYLEKIENINAIYICDNFESESLTEIFKEADLIYMDPPYLITNAVYNENNGWTNKNEYALLEFIDKLIENKKHFILSNVIEKKGRKNEPLSYWCEKNKDKIDIETMVYNYRSASYNKINRESAEVEIIIKLKDGVK